jgi:alkaline phosphatase D
MPTPAAPLPGNFPLTRRRFVLAGASLAAAAAASSARLRGAVAAAPKLTGYPFSLGVASGDPTPDGFVLWTRLAPRPLEPGGGMPAEPVEVSWQVAEDEGMGRVVTRGTAVANPGWAHAVHVEVAGLRPGRWYWYQFRVGSEVSPKGRTRTFPAPTELPERLRFAFASCQHYESGLYTAYEHMVREDLDLIVHLGDYIYEGGVTAGRTRKHNGAEIRTLDDYRARHALYRLDPALQAAHAAAPWLVTWDDHEVVNNYAGDIPQDPDRTTREQFLRRRAAAYQAYYEAMPLRRAQLPNGPDLPLYRRATAGRLADFHVLDTRQYRSDQPLGDGRKPPHPALLDPQGTLLGAAQREWLRQGLERSPATWNVLAQQVMFARVDRTPGPEISLSMDQWPGYEHERRLLLRHWREAGVRNPVVITGDIHTNWANELGPDFERPDDPVTAVEFVGTSISSSGDGRAEPRGLDRLLAENPGVKFHNEERGYVSCEITPQAWTAHFRTVPFVTRPGAPLVTRASCRVEAGRPKLERV